MSTLTPGELEVYQACSQAEDRMLRQKELEKSTTIKGADMAAAVNGLLKKSLLKIMKDSKGVLSYKAVEKADAKIVGLMDADESIVYKKIQEAKNEGIWTKHLKSTELHQSIITRALKSLEKKGLVKSIKSVKHPTRKIYILANLQPSVEVSGGPWYNNSEFETEFVKTLCDACLNFIQKRSYPMHKSKSKLSPRALFPTSQSSRYPTAADVLNFLKSSNITDTPLEISHVESLLQVLIYDGLVEALPGSGLANMPDIGGGSDKDSGSDSDSESSDDESSRKKKRRKKDKEKEKSSSSKKGKKRPRDDPDSDSDNDSSASSDATAARKKKRRKAADNNSDSDSANSDSDPSEEVDAHAKKRKNAKSRSKSKSKSRRATPDSEPGSESDSDSSNSDSDSDSGRGRKKSKSKPKSRSTSKSKSKKSKVKREPSPVEVQFDATAGRIYRAVRPERVALGWSQSPCGTCPQFDFCHDDGPVNARECQYYSTWLNAGIADAE
ncbi:DNA-directed RNA polymerase III subunit rpc6, putative [Rhizoctonia solani AG-3 Rhs1AP]|uniref:DNA-directed RNA polymerase III subunit rpc6, putative n=1 Tax=Rhizoctonia solani AG-3 Rhs1AP TaxID=1086054 RepID=X8JB48_9AGAM|nr:DNA-directed RNA polymerase III subunit rpc6, putative [Rhizoctonia solani AG-3 Rhs1AP]